MHTFPNEYILSFDFSLDRLDGALADPNSDWIIPTRPMPATCLASRASSGMSRPIQAASTKPA